MAVWQRLTTARELAGPRYIPWAGRCIGLSMAWLDDDHEVIIDENI